MHVGVLLRTCRRTEPAERACRSLRVSAALLAHTGGGVQNGSIWPVGRLNGAAPQPMAAIAAITVYLTTRPHGDTSGSAGDAVATAEPALVRPAA